MARPKPNLIKQVDLPTGQTWQLIEARGIYVILYQGQPASLRVIDGLGNQIYKKMIYTELGSARRQMRKLNQYFNTDEFQIAQVGE